VILAVWPGQIVLIVDFQPQTLKKQPRRVALSLSLSLAGPTVIKNGRATSKKMGGKLTRLTVSALSRWGTKSTL
jgi:hypothetical protein